MLYFPTGYIQGMLRMITAPVAYALNQTVKTSSEWTHHIYSTMVSADQIEAKMAASVAVKDKRV